MKTARELQNFEVVRALYLRDFIKEKDETIFNYEGGQQLRTGSCGRKKANVAQVNKDTLLKDVEHAQQELEAARAEKPIHGL
ncbi:uncharacterized protein PHALS_03527 [Plasmopara halstedii]|uniref:Uncharacterized protein n=1 Tax=Plasmopara halstedii TaxID=4781 RepID=A0A0P1AZ67_PLAHL|nr:uncharacterized protein PHALS_03527 [Plasmopara halstedii]CEG46850.1 hypothetical protein PHALS_03527 [Plasmopara halstedii]|eukprot:XP_024583219.1 hypothetical protein PHALS_03527 [Plasmopara halstedii]